MRYYRNVFDLGDLKTALQEAFEIKQDRYKYESLGAMAYNLTVVTGDKHFSFIKGVSIEYR